MQAQSGQDRFKIEPADGAHPFCTTFAFSGWRRSVPEEKILSSEETSEFILTVWQSSLCVIKLEKALNKSNFYLDSLDDSDYYFNRMNMPLQPECPYCSVPLRAVAMQCTVCGTEIRGRFRQTLFQLLDADEQEFLEKYLLADFSIKALAAEGDMGYAAIRSRLDRLIAHYQQLRSKEDERKLILQKVASGALTAAKAAELIAKIDAP
ncbi:MAG: DUF2089 family protein [FCB group bacterium]|nr:DUF2089 family protein [FCB group bacterium]